MCNGCVAVSGAGASSGGDAASAFAERMLGTLNESSLALMMSVGYRTGLFEAMRGAGWLTSVELAARSSMTERYVREWLGAMATGRVVEIDGTGEADRFLLPDAHASVLTDAGEGMARTFQWVSLLGGVESRVVECFERGGGVPYEAYERFHEVMAEESDGTVVGALEEHILPLVPGLVERLESGIDALDIGCGSGRAVCAMAARFPRSRFVGYDLCDPAVERARAVATERGLSNARFSVRDVTDLGDAGSFDLVTGFDVIHDQRDPAGVLRAVRGALREDGTFLMQDLRCHTAVSENVGHPLCPFLYGISAMHCMTVSLAQQGAGLGAAWGEELAVRMLKEAGFSDVTVKTLPHDILNNWYVMGRGAG